MPLLDDEVRAQVEQVLAPLDSEVELLVYTGGKLIVPGRDEPGEQQATLELLREVAATNDKITVAEKALAGDAAAAAAGITLTPTTVFRRKGEERFNVRFLGLPSGYEFSTLLETILMVGDSQRAVDSSLQEVSEVDADVRLRTFVTPTCPYCPKAVITAFRFALANPRITAEGIEANEFPTLSSGYRISGVPDTIVEGAPGSGMKTTRVLGAQPEDAFVDALKEAVASRPQAGVSTGA
ncbi:MAG TPA: thioredoxin family protein [Trueperaceae bacterium]|nr:thioredoxin family protein [Trueperaceae bacterium]